MDNLQYQLAAALTTLLKLGDTEVAISDELANWDIPGFSSVELNDAGDMITVEAENGQKRTITVQ